MLVVECCGASTIVISGAKYSVCWSLYLWSMFQYSSVHSLVRKKPDVFAAQIGDKVDLICIFSRGTKLTHGISVKAVLATYLEASRTEGMRFRGGKSFGVFLDEQGLDW